MQYVLYCFGIKLKFTLVYHHEADPIVRRYRDLKLQIGILVQTRHKFWGDKLSAIRFAMNTNLGNVFDVFFVKYGVLMNDFQRDFRAILEVENFVPQITPYLMKISDTMKKVREHNERQQLQIV